MKLKITFLLITFCFTTIYSGSQNDLNGYKYILVPKKFGFQKTENKYQLSSLTTFLFNKEGFITLLEGEEVPEELYDNPCLGLKAVVQNKSNILTTKVLIGLLDCRNTEVFISAEGKSKEKNFKKAFQQSIRRAFESVKALNYTYDRNNVVMQQEVVEVKEKPVKDELVEEVAPMTVSEPKVVNNVEEQIVEVVEVAEESTDTAIVKDVVVTVEPENVASAVEVLYAQSKPYGFQLVDGTPKVVYILQNSSVKELFILKNKQGILHKKNGKWIAEYYENDSLVEKELTIKF